MTESNASLFALLRKVEPIVRLAGEAILKVYNQPDIGLKLKVDASPLTDADLASEAVLRNGLRQLQEQYLIVSEESAGVPFALRKSAQRLWLVDPLDGTKEFVKRNDEFCVCLALIEAGRPSLAVIHAPVTGVSYFAILNGGVHIIDQEGVMSQLSSKPKLDKKDTSGLRFGVSRSHLNKATEDFLKTYKAPSLIPMGSALKFCAIAESRLDIYPRFGPTMEWDTAAGDLLIHEAGGEVLDANTGEKLVYNKEELLNPSFIAKRWRG